MLLEETYEGEMPSLLPSVLFQVLVMFLVMVLVLVSKPSRNIVR